MTWILFRSRPNILVVTPHAQRERGKVIDRGVHIYTKYSTLPSGISVYIYCTQGRNIELQDLVSYFNFLSVNLWRRNRTKEKPSKCCSLSSQLAQMASMNLELLGRSSMYIVSSWEEKKKKKGQSPFQ